MKTNTKTESVNRQNATNEGRDRGNIIRNGHRARNSNRTISVDTLTRVHIDTRLHKYDARANAQAHIIVYTKKASLHIGGVQIKCKYTRT